MLCCASWTRFQSWGESRGKKTKDLCWCSFLKHYVGTTVQALLLFNVKSLLPFQCIWVRLATWLRGIQKWDISLAFFPPFIAEKSLIKLLIYSHFYVVVWAGEKTPRGQSGSRSFPERGFFSSKIPNVWVTGGELRESGHVFCWPFWRMIR